MTENKDLPMHYFLVTINFVLNGNLGFGNVLTSNNRPSSQAIVDFEARSGIIEGYKKNIQNILIR